MKTKLFFLLLIVGTYVYSQSIVVGYSHRDLNVATVGYLQHNKAMYYGAAIGAYDGLKTDSLININGDFVVSSKKTINPLILLRVGARTNKPFFAFAEMSLFVTTTALASPIPYIGIGYNKKSNWTFKLSINSLSRKINYGAEIGYNIRKAR